MMRRLAWPLGVSVLVILVGALVWHVFTPNNPIKIASEISGFTLPDTSELLHEEKDWNEFLGDGYSLWIISVPKEFERTIMDDCETLGYRLGNFSEMKISIAVVEPYLSHAAQSCYRYKGTLTASTLVIVSGGKLLVYIDES